MRLFVALLLEPALLEALNSIQSVLRRLDTSGSVRWVDPRGIHLTLKFLGEVDEARLEPLTAALTAAARSRTAPRLALGSPGVFPGPGRPRVLWIGLRESGQHLPPLAEAVESAMNGLGWPKEKRAFQPHVTLGRVRDQARPNAARDLAAKLDTVSVPETAEIPHTRLALMQSHLGPAGARYAEVGLWRLQ